MLPNQSIRECALKLGLLDWDFYVDFSEILKCQGKLDRISNLQVLLKVEQHNMVSTWGQLDLAIGWDIDLVLGMH